MSGGVVPYNFTLAPIAGLWIYSPSKQGTPDIAWNASYTGSGSWPDFKTQDMVGEGINYFRTQSPQAQVSINFEGTGIYFCFTENGADYVLTVDGKSDILKTAPGNSDDACKATGASTMAFANDLSLGAHTAIVRLAASVQEQFNFFGGMMTTAIPASGTVGSKVTVLDKWVDDTDPAIKYQPPQGGINWDPTGGGAGFHNLTNTFHCNYGEGNLTTYSFTGAGAALLWGNAWRDSNDFTLDIAGGSVSETLVSAMSSSGWKMGQSLVWMRGNLDPNTTYTITYRDWNAANPSCRVNIPANGSYSCCIAFDGVQLFSVESLGDDSTPPPAKKSSNNLGAILGGVFGGLAFAAAIFALFIFMRRRNKQKAKQAEPTPAHWGTTSLPATYTSASSPQYSNPAAWSPMPSTTSPPASTVQSNHYFGAPSSVAPSSHAPTSAGPVPLGQADMDRVLQFVQRQMDTRAAGRDEDEAGTVLPPYSH